MFCIKVYTIILFILLVCLDVDAIIYSCCVCGILICELLGVWGICSWFFKVFSPLICTHEFDIKSTMHEIVCHKQPLLEIFKCFNAFQQQIFLNFNINNKFQQHVEVHNWMLTRESFDIWFYHEHHVCCCLCMKPLLLKSLPFNDHSSFIT
jgi:hypothetical protein